MAKLVEGKTEQQGRPGLTEKISRGIMMKKKYAGEVGLAAKTGRGKK